MKNKEYHTFGTVSKTNRKTMETEIKSITLMHKKYINGNKITRPNTRSSGNTNFQNLRLAKSNSE